jgi:hypothetical protein
MSPTDDSNDTANGSSSGDAPPPGPSSDGSLGLDDAWAQLSATGKGVVVGSAAVLLVAAAVGFGFGLAGGGDSGDGTAVISETSGSVVTLEVPPTTEVVPTETGGLPTDSTTPALPDATGTTGEGPPNDAATTGDPATGVRVFTDADGSEIGTISITEPSEVSWTSGGTTFVLIDEASGATLVDAVDAEGSLALEVGEYDFRVEADSGWTITVRPR